MTPRPPPTAVMGIRQRTKRLLPNFPIHLFTLTQTIRIVWRATQSQVEQVLASIDRALRAAGQQYLETEMANARLFAY